MRNISCWLNIWIFEKFGRNVNLSKFSLTLLHSERPTFYAILAFLGAIELKIEPSSSSSNLGDTEIKFNLQLSVYGICLSICIIYYFPFFSTWLKIWAMESTIKFTWFCVHYLDSAQNLWYKCFVIYTNKNSSQKLKEILKDVEQKKKFFNDIILIR